MRRAFRASTLLAGAIACVVTACGGTVDRDTNAEDVGGAPDAPAGSASPGGQGGSAPGTIDAGGPAVRDAAGGSLEEPADPPPEVTPPIGSIQQCRPRAPFAVEDAGAASEPAPEDAAAHVVGCPESNLGVRVETSASFSGSSLVFADGRAYASGGLGGYCYRECVTLDLLLWSAPAAGGEVLEMTGAPGRKFTAVGEHVYWLAADGAVHHATAPCSRTRVVLPAPQPAVSSADWFLHIAASGSDLYWFTFTPETSTPTLVRAAIAPDGSLSEVARLEEFARELVADEDGLSWIGEEGVRSWPRDGSAPRTLTRNTGDELTDARLAANATHVFLSRMYFGPDRREGSTVWRGEFLGAEIASVSRETEEERVLLETGAEIHAVVATDTHLFWIDTRQRPHRPGGGEAPCGMLWMQSVDGGAPEVVASGEDLRVGVASRLAAHGGAAYLVRGRSLYRFEP